MNSQQLLEQARQKTEQQQLFTRLYEIETIAFEFNRSRISSREFSKQLEAYRNRYNIKR